MIKPQRQVSFSLPLVPISLNRMWRQFRGRTIVSEEGRQFKRDVAILIRAQNLDLSEYNGKGIEIEAHFFSPKFYTKKGEISLTGKDIDNLWKVLGDCLFEQIGINDSHVLSLHLHKHHGDMPRTAVILSFST